MNFSKIKKKSILFLFTRKYIKGMKVIFYLNTIMINSVACYGSELWILKTEEQTKLLALEMYYLRRSARVSRLQKIPNTRSKIVIEGGEVP